jgi:serine/threonine protein kinase
MSTGHTDDDRFGLVGTTIEQKYRVDAVVGEGGFGVVYRGWHARLDVPIAIKVLKTPSHFGAEARAAMVERFQLEGKTLAKLSDDAAIVRVLDIGVTAARTESSLPFLVLEWLEGRSLADELAARGRPYSVDEAVELVAPLARALAEAHAANVAHRDVKPENVFVVKGRRGATVKLVDFGIAKAMQEGESVAQKTTRTSSGFHAFSPRYGSPEQFRAKVYGPTGPWTDVHALGLVFVELVTGRPAYDGEESADFYEAATAEGRPTPRARGAVVPDAIEAWCARALARASAERFQDAGELLRALEAAHGALGAPPSLSTRPSVAATELVSETEIRAIASQSSNASSTSAPTVVARETPQSRQSASRPRPAILAAAGAGALALVAVAAFALRTPTSESEPASSGLARAAVSAQAAKASASPDASASPAPAASSEAFGQPDTVPLVGGKVVARTGKQRFVLRTVQAAKDGRVLADDVEVAESETSPASCPFDWPWRAGEVVLFAKPGNSTLGFGVVESVRIDQQLTVRAWDGASRATLTFSPPQSMKPGHLPLANAWPVRRAWVASVRDTLERAEAALEEDKRAECFAKPECKKQLEAKEAEEKAAAERKAAEEKAAAEKKAAEEACTADPACAERRRKEAAAAAAAAAAEAQAKMTACLRNCHSEFSVRALIEQCIGRCKGG